MVMESLSAFLHALRLHWVSIAFPLSAIMMYLALECLLARACWCWWDPIAFVSYNNLCKMHLSADSAIVGMQVEFQNKFYHGDGVQFKPFTFAASDLEL